MALGGGVGGSSGKGGGQPLTAHESLLGSVVAIVRTRGLVPWRGVCLDGGGPVVKRRVHGKQHVREADRSCHALLQVLSIAAWVELTEKWHDLPSVADGAPSMVCNQSAFETRCLAGLVDKGRIPTANPLTEHLCAM